MEEHRPGRRRSAHVRHRVARRRTGRCSRPPHRARRRLDRLARTPPGKKAAAGATYSLQVAAPLDALLATLAKRLELTLDIDRALLHARGIAGGEIIRLDVTNVSRDELLEAILDPLALDWQIEEQTLRVHGR